MKKTTKIISVILSLLIIVSAIPISASGSALNASSYDTAESIITGNGLYGVIDYIVTNLNNINNDAIGSLLKLYYLIKNDDGINAIIGDRDISQLSNSDSAKILVDWLDADILPEIWKSIEDNTVIQTINNSIPGLSVDLGSVQDVYNTLAQFNDFGIKTVLATNVLGDLKNIDVSALNNITVKGNELNAVKKLFTFLKDNLSSTKAALNGEFDLGTMNEFVADYLEPFTQLGLLIKSAIYKLIDPNAAIGKFGKDEMGGDWGKSAYSSYSADQLIVSALLKVINKYDDETVVSKSEANEALDLSFYGLLSKYGPILCKNFADAFVNDTFQAFVESLNDVAPELRAQFKETIPIIDENSFKDVFENASYEGLIERINDITVKFCELVLTRSVYDQLGLIKGDNSNLNANLIKICRYILPLLIKNEGLMGYSIPEEIKENYATMDASELAAYVIKPFFGILFYNSDYKTVNSADSIADLCVLAAYYFATSGIINSDYDFSAIAAEIFEASGSIKDLRNDECTTLIFKTVTGIVAGYLKSNADKYHFNISLDGADWKNVINQISNWALDFFKGLPAVSVKHDIRTQNDYGPFYKINVILNELFDFSFLNNVNDATFTLDLNTLFSNAVIGNIYSFDFESLLSVFEKNNGSDNILSGKIISSVLKASDRIITALFEHTCNRASKSDTHPAAGTKQCTHTVTDTYDYCKTCGAYFSKLSKENKLAQSAQTHEYKTISSEQITIDGSTTVCKIQTRTTKVCQKCGDTVAITTSAAHKNQQTGIIPATCSEYGKRIITCAVCNYEQITDISSQPPTGKHTWDGGEILKEATETEEGSILYTCTVCGATKTEIIDKIHVGPVYKLGDVSNDYSITAEDARLALRRAIDLESFAVDSAEFLAADVNRDGKVTAADARLILRRAVSLEKLSAYESLPLPETYIDSITDLPSIVNDSDSVFELRSDGEIEDDYIWVTLVAKNCVGIKAADMIIEYDPSVLTLRSSIDGTDANLSSEAGNTFSGLNNKTIPGAIISSFFFLENLWDETDFESFDVDINSEEFKVFNYKFHVKESGVNTELRIKLKSIDGIEATGSTYTLNLNEPHGQVDYDITTGQTLNIEVSEERETYIRFIPEVSGYYSFSSSSDNDTKVYLYNNNFSSIVYDDDSGENGNFDLRYELEAGKTYYFGVGFWSSNTGSFDVTLKLICSHNNISVNSGYPATCAAPGRTNSKICVDCGKVFETAELSFVDHTDQNKDGICDVCGMQTGDVVIGKTCYPKLEADEWYHAIFVPTITASFSFETDGYYKILQDGHELNRGSDSNALERGKAYELVFNFDEGDNPSFTVDVAHYSDGEIDEINKNCEYTQREYYCVLCGERVFDYLLGYNHIFGEPVIEQESPQSPAYRVYRCTECWESYRELMPFNEHNRPVKFEVVSVSDLYENVSGYSYDGYFHYDIDESDIEYKVTFEDGTSKTFNRYYNIDLTYDGNTDSAPWALGPHDVTAVFYPDFESEINRTNELGRVTFTINLVENPVQSVTARYLKEYPEGYYTYKNNTYYIFEGWIQLTVTYKDGTSETFRGDEVRHFDLKANSDGLYLYDLFEADGPGKYHINATYWNVDTGFDIIITEVKQFNYPEQNVPNMGMITDEIQLFENTSLGESAFSLNESESVVFKEDQGCLQIIDNKDFSLKKELSAEDLCRIANIVTDTDNHRTSYVTDLKEINDEFFIEVYCYYATEFSAESKSLVLRTTDFGSISIVNIPEGAESIEFANGQYIAYGEKYENPLYVETHFGKDYYILKADSYLVYYTSEDLLNWQRRSGPIFGEMLGNNSIGSVQSQIVHTTEKGILLLNYENSGNGDGGEYDVYGLYYTNDFKNYICLSDDFSIDSYVNVCQNSAVDGKILFSVYENDIPTKYHFGVLYGCSKSNPYSRTSVYCFDESSGELTCLFTTQELVTSVLPNLFPSAAAIITVENGQEIVRIYNVSTGNLISETLSGIKICGECYWYGSDTITDDYRLGFFLTQDGQDAKLIMYNDTGKMAYWTLPAEIDLSEIRPFTSHENGSYWMYLSSDNYIYKISLNSIISEMYSGHIHSWDSGVITKPATCADFGEKIYTCTECGETRTEHVAKSTNHIWASGIVTTPATCAAAGVKTFTCTVCGATKTEPVAKTTNHTWNAGVVTTQPTVTSEGVKTFTCTVCGATKTEKIAKLTPTAINTPTVKEVSGSVYAAPQLTAADVVKAAGTGAKILKADGKELKSGEKVGSGMTLVKPDGTKETIIVKGDNDGDGSVTASDARYALRTAVKLETPNTWEKNASEVDGQDGISASDARMILRAAVKLEKLDLY